MQKTGLTDNDIQKIKEAANTYKRYSDIDLCIMDENIDYNTFLKFADFIENETNFPYTFDICVYKNIKNEALKKHIDDRGILL